MGIAYYYITHLICVFKGIFIHTILLYIHMHFLCHNQEILLSCVKYRRHTLGLYRRILQFMTHSCLLGPKLWKKKLESLCIVVIELNHPRVFVFLLFGFLSFACKIFAKYFFTIVIIDLLLIHTCETRRLFDPNQHQSEQSLWWFDMRLPFSGNIRS